MGRRQGRLKPIWFHDNHLALMGKLLTAPRAVSEFVRSCVEAGEVLAAFGFFVSSELRFDLDRLQRTLRKAGLARKRGS